MYCLYLILLLGILNSIQSLKKEDLYTPWPGCPKGPQGAQDDVKLEVKDDCNQFIHCESFGKPQLKNCPSILVFDKKAKQCIWPWDSDRNCHFTTTEKTTEKHTTEHGSGEITTEAGTNEVTTEQPLKCPPGIADPKNTVHLEIPGKCNQFVHCDNFGVGHIKNCAPSNPALVFDKSANSCVWPWESKRKDCDGSESEVTTENESQETTEHTSEEITTEAGSNETTEHGSGEITTESGTNETTEHSSGEITTEAGSNEVTTEQPQKCPSGIADPKNHVHLEIPGKCNQFVHCDNFGVGHIKNCAPSNPALVFDKSANACVWPWESKRKDCDGSENEVTTENESQETTEHGSGEITTEAGTNDTTEHGSGEITTESGTNDTTEHGSGEITTEAGTNDTTEHGSGEITTESGINDTTEHGSGEITTEAGTNDTTEHGSGDITTEAGTNDTTEHGSGEITTDSGTNDTTEHGSGEITTESGTNETTEHGSGEITTESGTNETTEHGSGEITTESGTNDTTEHGSGEITTEAGTNETTENPPEQCPTIQITRFPHANNCQQYYECAPAYLRTCPPGLKYNPDINECDLEGSVQCRNEQVNDTSAWAKFVTKLKTAYDNYVDSGCPDNSNERKTVEIKNNCTHYVECHGRFRTEVRRCPMFKYFEPKYGRCIPFHRVERRDCIRTPESRF